MKITCNAASHIFYQSPEKHINRKQGCPECAKITRWNTRGRYTYSQFVAEASVLHNNLYTYPELNSTIYLNKKKDIVIYVCKVHGEVSQNVANHLAGKGCSQCAGNVKKTKEQFQSKAKSTHKDKYSYEKFVYVDAKTKGTIICPLHGEFLQSPDSHINAKSGCIECLPQGMFSEKYFMKRPENKEIPSYLYLIRLHNEEESFYKIGLTTKTTEQRYKYFNLECNYKVEILYEEKCSLYEAWQREQQILKLNHQYKYQPKQIFRGFTECLRF